LAGHLKVQHSTFPLAIILFADAVKRHFRVSSTFFQKNISRQTSSHPHLQLRLMIINQHNTRLALEPGHLISWICENGLVFLAGNQIWLRVRCSAPSIA
jgi:hypothetical protein